MRFYPILSAALALYGACASAQQPAFTLDSSSLEYPVVLTPTRLRQSLADVPASVTVITAETIRRYGIMSVPDALRLVPGMAITHASGSDYRINYHGTNILIPRRMNVLIDGISVYRPALARVDWKELPVTMEDIDRIEVTRSPNSATYGTNSMLAIVNIITKHPNDVERAMVAATAGSLNTRNVTGRFATTVGSTALRGTVNREEDEGYDTLSRTSAPHDSTRLNRLNVRSHTQLGESSTLGLQLAVVQGVAEVPFVDAAQRSFPDRHLEDYYVGGVWTKSFTPTHELQLRANYSHHDVRQEWVTCPATATLLPQLFALFAANPSYANTVLAGRVPTGASAADNALAAAAVAAIVGLGPRARQPTCTTPNQNLVESRADIEFQDTYVFSDRLRLVAGLGLRNDRTTSQTFFGGTLSNTSYRAFGNVEYRPSDWLNLNAGAYVERDDLVGFMFSPRLAANVHISPNQTIRAAYSEGTRTPDFFEQRANWTYTATDATPPLNGSSNVRFYQSGVGRGNLSEERIISRELGYLWKAQGIGLLFDVRIFDDKLTNLISEKLQVANFQPTNNNSMRLQGADLQATLAPTDQWSLFFAYGYLRSRDVTNLLERTQYSRHSGAVGLTQALPYDWRWSLAYYGASGDGLGQNYYGREDLTVSKTVKLAGARLTSSIILRRFDNRSVNYARDFGDTLVSGYDDRFQLYGYLKLSF